MTDEERLREIAARAAAATPGPWESQGDGHAPSNGKTMAWVMVEDTFVDVADMHNGPRAYADAKFIAAAREDVPWLLSVLAESKRARTEARATEWHRLWDAEATRSIAAEAALAEECEATRMRGVFRDAALERAERAEAAMAEARVRVVEYLKTEPAWFVAAFNLEREDAATLLSQPGSAMVPDLEPHMGALAQAHDTIQRLARERDEARLERQNADEQRALAVRMLEEMADVAASYRARAETAEQCLASVGLIIAEHQRLLKESGAGALAARVAELQAMVDAAGSFYLGEPVDSIYPVVIESDNDDGRGPIRWCLTTDEGQEIWFDERDKALSAARAYIAEPTL